MVKRGKLYIIPDENQILESEFYREVSKDHVDGMIEFIKNHNLNINLPVDDAQTASCMLANAGHLVVKTEDTAGLAIVYIPKMVTDRQNMWIHSHESELFANNYIGAFAIDKENDYQSLKKESGLHNIIRLCDRRNLFYEKKEDDKNVGKKI